MEKFKRLSKKSILLSWIIAYVAIFAIPLITGVRVMSIYNAELERETRRKNISSVELICNNLSDSLEWADAFYMEVIKSPYYLELLNCTDEELFYREYGNRFLDDVSLRTLTLQNLELWYIYSVDTGKIIAPNGMFESDFFYQTYLRTTLMNIDEWEKYMSFDSLQKHGTLKGLDSNYLIYNIPMRNLNLKKTGYVLSFLINAEAFFKNVSELKGKCTIEIKDAYGKEVYSLTSPNMNKQRFILNDTIMVNTTKLNVIVEIESYVANSSMRKMKRILAIYIFVDLIIGVCLMLLFLRRNYNPIARMILQIGENDIGEENELKIIENYLKNIISDNERLQDTTSKQEKDIKGLIIKQSLFTSLDENDIKNTNLIGENEQFMLVAFYMQNPDKFELKKDGTVRDKIRELNYVISNITEDLIEKDHFETINVSIDNASLFMIKIKDQGIQYERKINDYLEFVVKFINEDFGGDIYEISSKIYSSANEINIAYSEIKNIEEKRRIFGTNQYILNDKTIDTEYDFNVEREFHRCITNKDFDGAKNAANIILDRMQNNREATPMSIKIMLIYLAMTVANLTHDTVKDFASITPEEIIGICTSIESTREFISKCLEEANAQKYSEYKNSMQNVFISKIISHIESNYSDTNLNMSKIGDMLRMTPAYLSKLFKNEKGESVSEYINKVRIDKAKELLSNPNYRIEDISEMVGFGSVRTFNRTFRALTGISPSKYAGR